MNCFKRGFFRFFSGSYQDFAARNPLVSLPSKPIGVLNAASSISLFSAMATNRTIRVIAFERKRITMRPLQMRCPICQCETELLTVRQAGRLAQVRSASIYRWLASGKAHGVKTAGGGHRVCRNSLFHSVHFPLSRGEEILACAGDEL